MKSEEAFEKASQIENERLLFQQPNAANVQSAHGIQNLSVKISLRVRALSCSLVKIKLRKKSKEIDLWSDIAEQYKNAAEYEKRAVIMHNLGQINTRDHWAWSSDLPVVDRYFARVSTPARIARENRRIQERETARCAQADVFAGYTANRLEEASAALEKATKARQANMEEVAILWLKAVRQYQDASDFHAQAAKATIRTDVGSYDRFDKAAVMLRTMAVQSEKEADEREKSGNR
ncbi:MAG TPA: hypothetical protein VJK54_06870 [Chthoniobacterales bacterium]|nr:hypothetical protein [Chthoniobacterales bacterium]